MFEQKYIVMQTIGRSNYTLEMTSIVKNRSNNYFIAKKVPIDDAKTMHQIRMMRTLAHPNIIALHEIIEEDNWAYIIQEYCEQGDLEYHLKRQAKTKKYIQEEVIGRWLLQILLALEYLHSLKIIHRDIRPRNIFLTANGNIKIGSFKVSKLLEKEVNYAQTLISSPYYLTPELAEGKVYDFKVDIWAFGCVMYEICALKPPIILTSINELLSKMAKGKVDDLPHNYTKQLNILFQKCMKKNPLERISARNLLKTNYFLEIMERFIADKGLNINFHQKIPIKKYNIHHSKYEKMKIKKKLIKEKTPTVVKKDALLPKITVQSHKLQRKLHIGKEKIKEMATIVLTPVLTKKGVEKPISSRYERSFSTQQQKIVGHAIRDNGKLSKPPIISMQESYKKPPLISQQKILLFAPPFIPNPKRFERASTELGQKSRAVQQEMINEFQMTIPKEQLQKQLANFQKKQLHNINNGLSKIFENLNFKQDNDEQIEFDFKEDCQLRLTSKQIDETASLLVTCKSKLQQLIEEINYKYCPNLQPIPEKTTEFDSNSFMIPQITVLKESSR